MEIGESTNSEVAKLVREELFKSMGSLSTSISTFLPWTLFFFTLYYERKEESPEVTMGLNDSSLSYYYICGYRRYKACGREIIYGLR